MLSHRVQKSLHWLENAIPAAPLYPEDVVKMDSAENWLVRPHILPLMKEALRHKMTDEHLSYQKNYGGYPELLQNTSAMLNKFFSPLHPVQPEHIVAGAGAAMILDTIDFAICDDGDGLLIDAPMWEGFGLASNLRNDDRLVPVARPPCDAISREEVFAHYAKAMEAAPCRVRGIIVCNPQNPYGHIYPRSWVEAVLQFCQEHDIHYISDEIYALSTFGPAQTDFEISEKSQPIFESPETTFTSILSFDLARLGVDPSRVHLIYGISKDLGSSGLRLGFFITQQNPRLRHALAVLNRFRVSNASALMGTGLFADLLALEAALARTRVELRAAAEYVGDFLAFHRVAFYRPVAGCFLWARLGGVDATAESDAEMWRRFASAGVALASGRAFGEHQHGWFRITYALPQADLVRGVRRIEMALAPADRWTPPAERKEEIADLVVVEKRDARAQQVQAQVQIQAQAQDLGLQARRKKSPKGFGVALKWIMGWL